MVEILHKKKNHTDINKTYISLYRIYRLNLISLKKLVDCILYINTTFLLF